VNQILSKWATTGCLLLILAFALPWIGSESRAESHQAATAFRVSPTRNGDKVAVDAGEELVTVAITSVRGIGQATIARRGKQWSKEVVLRLRLRGLESLTVAAGPLKLAVSVDSNRPHVARLYLWKDGTEGPALDKKSPYWTSIQIVPAKEKQVRIPLDPGGCFQVALPSALLADNPESLEVRWIDFYR